MTLVQRIALVLTVVGALNWGLVGVFDFNLVSYLFNGDAAVFARIIYGLVGISGLINIGLLFSEPSK